MQKTKKQHYVPQFYLKNFSSNKQNINVFDKNLGKSFGATIKDIACSNYFYDVDIDINHDPKIIEDFPTVNKEQIFESIILADIEVKCKTSFDSVIKELNKQRKLLINNIFLKNLDSITNSGISKNITKINSLQLNKNDIDNISIFIVLQFLRTKKRRKEIAEIFKLMLEKIAEIKTPDFHDNFNILIHEDKLASHHILMILDNIELFTKYIRQQEWMYLINLSDIPFWTSDNPVVLDRSFCPKDGRGKGFMSQGVNFYIPISDKYLLFIIEKQLFKDIKKNTILTDTEIVIPATYDHVIYANDLQLIHSHVQIYSPNDKEFDWAKKYCDKNPDICNKNRKFIE